jgi:DNA-binding XRE family transcriptional regulator
MTNPDLEFESDLAELKRHLDQIEKHARAAKGETGNADIDPWDFAIPTSHELRLMREKCGYTQGELSDQIDYAKHTINQYEAGVRPGLQYIQACLRVYKRDWPRGGGHE